MMKLIIIIMKLNVFNYYYCEARITFDEASIIIMKLIIIIMKPVI